MSENLSTKEPAYGRRRFTLQADCEQCFGLCCAALPFAASVDFAADKAAGQPCGHLRDDFRCGIHGSLQEQGYRGCTFYDCFGAGQRVSQVTFAGLSWRQVPGSAKPMFDVFPVMWQLHELLWYLDEALSLPQVSHLHERLRIRYDETERLTSAKLDDLISAKLRGADLRGIYLRGAYLIAADLRGADLRGADMIGADLRDADVRGADLSESLFLTQAQINAAKGDAATKLPPLLKRPFYWEGASGRKEAR